MRHFYFALLFFGLLSASRSPVYYGNIIETINAPEVGYYNETFVSTYHYESSTIDGTFYAWFLEDIVPVDANVSLGGQIFLPYPKHYTDHWEHFFLPQYGNDDICYSRHVPAFLVVEGGHVTEFSYMFDSYYFTIASGNEQGGWITMDIEGGYDPTTGEPTTAGVGGSLRLTSPHANVADQGATVALLCFAFVGLAIAGRLVGWRAALAEEAG